MMGNREIAIAASALGNQIKAGLSAECAVRRMAGIQPRANWLEAAERIARGEPLSACLGGQWPEALVAAVAAGELSGALPDVLAQIEDMALLQIRISGSLRQFYMPALLALGGLSTFLFFMVSVIPAVSQSMTGLLMRKSEPSAIMRASAWMHSTFVDHWPQTLAIHVISIVGAIGLFRQPEFRDWLFAAADRAPLLGHPIRSLYFGLWARTLATLASAGGIDIVEMLTMSAQGLPTVLRLGPLRMAEEVIRRGLEEAGDPRLQSPDDPRARWPHYIGIAFAVSAQTGRIDVEMKRVAPILVDDGLKGIERAIQIANVAAMALGGALIMAPLAAYYMEMGKLMQQAMRG